MRASIVTLLATLAAPVCADDIVTWVDADGVTHFTNARLAPGDAEPVTVAPANGMAVPEGASAPRTRGRGPTAVILEKPANRETIGFRGHQWNVSRRGR